MVVQATGTEVVIPSANPDRLMRPQRVCETEPSCFKNTDGADWALRGAGSGAEREDARRQPSH